ncbi:MAG: Ger(x)C family spore germination protein [Clostridium thermopalmarium]|uniref:Ger(x)C family spore germination protein n=1 Tax=Clostridium thermopalmarium TaxID=29373 RepID=UPI00235372DE|nr:Ger(x)C family spore germination protein [Clostridium thermopalmarium]MBE6044050.1 Ger(x)C family spore germination protein [Clostridium thermopalmarium]
MRYKKIIILALTCCFLSGCWDKVEIDRRSFISTIAIDVGQNIDDEERFKEIKSNEVFKEKDFKKLNVIFGLPNISELGPESGSTAKEQIVTTEAFSMQDAVTELAAKMSRSVYTGHSKLLILSDKIIEYPETMKEIFDYLERQPDINKMMLVVVAKGNAEDFVKFEPNMEKNIESYITGLMENGISNFSVLPVRLNDIFISMYKNKTAVIPTIEFDKINKNQLNISGVALIKDYKIEGYLTPEEDASLEILKGKIKGGKEVILIDGHPVELHITGIKRRIYLEDDTNPKKLKFNIQVLLEGQLKGYYIDSDIFSQGEIEKIQDNFNDVIERKCEKVGRIIQEQHPIDAIGLEEYIEKFKPQLYKKIKDNWEEVYKNANIDVTVNTKARRLGVTK